MSGQRVRNGGIPQDSDPLAPNLRGQVPKNDRQTAYFTISDRL
jgi:hypothetical protein